MRARVVLIALLGLVLIFIGFYSLANAANCHGRTTPTGDICVNTSKGKLTFTPLDQQTQSNQLVGTGEIVLGLVLMGIAIAGVVKARK